MVKKTGEPKPRGVFERPPGSGVWWVQYWDVGGKRRREKVGRQSEAIKKYDKLKKEIVLVKSAKRAGVWVEKPKAGATLSELIDDALQFVKDHKHKDQRNYHSRGEIVRAALGSRPAAEIEPLEIDGWLRKHCKTPATTNRYRAFLSLCYQQGIFNKKVATNPARAVRHRKEPEGRLNYLRREEENDEYRRLHEIITRRCPEHLAEFEVSVHSGMRLSEQYTVTWPRVDLKRGVIRLFDTKNGTGRNVYLNQTALEALKSVRPEKSKPTDVVFSHPAADFDNGPWFNPCVEEAGLIDYTWHNNRHTFCSWLALKGATLKEIQEAAGHKSIAMSARYAHLSPAHTASVVNRLDG